MSDPAGAGNLSPDALTLEPDKSTAPHVRHQTNGTDVAFIYWRVLFLDRHVGKVSVAFAPQATSDQSRSQLADRSVELDILLIHNFERESILVVLSSMSTHLFSALAIRKELA